MPSSPRRAERLPGLPRQALTASLVIAATVRPSSHRRSLAALPLSLITAVATVVAAIPVVVIGAVLSCASLVLLAAAPRLSLLTARFEPGSAHADQARPKSGTAAKVAQLIAQQAAHAVPSTAWCSPALPRASRLGCHHRRSHTLDARRPRHWRSSAVLASRRVAPASAHPCRRPFRRIRVAVGQWIRVRRRQPAARTPYAYPVVRRRDRWRPRRHRPPRRPRSASSVRLAARAAGPSSSTSHWQPSFPPPAGSVVRTALLGGRLVMGARVDAHAAPRRRRGNGLQPLAPRRCRPP